MALIIPLALGLMVGVSAWPIVRRIKSRYRPNPSPKQPKPSPETTEVDPITVIVMDRLDRIEGIPSGVARRLNQAGILTYADLAAQTPEHLFAIVNPKSPHRGQPIRTTEIRDWITQAQVLANSLTHGTPQPAS
jgi:predicted flap endonuclease-1-like 5' DNA nuclease